MFLSDFPKDFFNTHLSACLSNLMHFVRLSLYLHAEVVRTFEKRTAAETGHHLMSTELIISSLKIFMVAHYLKSRQAPHSLPLPFWSHKFTFSDRVSVLSLCLPQQGEVRTYRWKPYVNKVSADVIKLLVTSCYLTPLRVPFLL